MNKVTHMKLLSKLFMMCAATLFVGMGSAKADTSQLLVFNLTGPVNATFELSSNPVIDPNNADPGCGFLVTPINLMIGGTASNDFLAFYNGNCDGAFAAFSDAENADFSLVGNTLYQGSVYSPTFSPTSASGENMTDGSDDGQTYNLTISPIGTPEPSSLVLLGIVLLPLGIAAKRLL
jgi:hypothetical protein